jgi:hypothetical protein
MFVQRIALLAARLGIPVPSIAGNARLGLAGTIRVTEPIPLVFRPSLREELASDGVDLDSFIRQMNVEDVWVWCDGDDSVLHEVSSGSLWSRRPKTPAPSPGGDRDFTISFSGPVWGIRCAPDRDGGLRVLKVAQRVRGRGSILVGRFCIGPQPVFDPRGLCQLVASQRRIAAHVHKPELERDETEQREFLSQARRYLDALREHAHTARPSARYEVAALDPLQLRIVGADAWPRAFHRPDTRVEVPTPTGKTRFFTVVDVSDDGDVLTLDATASSGDVAAADEVTVKANDDSIKRMREALDTIAMETDPAHSTLLGALTHPEKLPALVEPLPSSDSPETERQDQAVALALRTPDIALIHGPPGTGKTTVISRIVEQLVRDGKKVLLVAPTHVALDNVLERVGDREGVTAIRLGSEANVDVQAQRFLIPQRRMDLNKRLQEQLAAALVRCPEGAVADVQRDWRERISNDDDIGALLLLKANLVCATPMGIAMAREFRDVQVVFDVMILDEASKATITDFLVPAARARKWILVGDAKQLPPYVDLADLEAVISQRVQRAELEETPEHWAQGLSIQLRRHFENRMHPSMEARADSWRGLVKELAAPLAHALQEQLVAFSPEPAFWRDQFKRGIEGVPPNLLRLGAELLEIQALALPSVFEHLSRLPASRAVRLNHQHRMAPPLASFSAELVYDGDYPSAADTALLGITIPTLEEESIWIDTAYAPREERFEYPRDQDWTGGDYENDLERDVALELIKKCADWATQSWRGDLRPNGRGPDASFEIGVICFYRQQAVHIQEVVAKRLGAGLDPWRRNWKHPAANSAPIDIHVSIVDRFQGREKDVVILCTTRSNPIGRRGHVDNLNRLNVAATRARHKRIVIGDSSTLVGKSRRPDDLLRRLHEMSAHKLRWGRVLGGQV